VFQILLEIEQNRYIVELRQGQLGLLMQFQ